MWRYWLGIVAAVLLISESASAQSRMALVIGNSNYQSAVSLPNPVNDAKAVADSFTRAGFEVTRLSDLTQMEMRREVRDFSARIAEKGSDTVALVYYAGHGVQVDGENFLIPVDARIQRESDVAIEALRLADIVKALETVQSRVRIVMLDACRNNPFSAVGASGRGLAIVDAPAGTIVAYSTAPGTEAEDGTGQNSPYTSALVRIIPEPGLPIEQALKRVRLLVHESTEGRQTPWESSSLISDFEFYPEGAPTSAGPGLPQVAQRDPHPRDVQTRDAQPRDTQSRNVQLRDTQSRDGKSRDTQSRDGQSQTTARSLAWREQIRSRPQPRQAYDIVVMEDSVDAYEEFLLLYPYDPLAERIRYLLSLRAQALAWRYAVLANTPDSYGYYLNSYPGGYYATQAMRLREQPRMRPVDSVMAPRVIEPPRPLRVSLPSSQRGDSKGASAPNGGKQGIGGSATTGLPPKTDQKTGDKTDQKMEDKTDQKKTDQKTGDKTDQKTGERIDRKTQEKIDRKSAGKTDRKIERSARKSGGATTAGVKSTVQKFSKSESLRNSFASGPQAAKASAVKNSAFSRSMSQSSFRSSSGGGGGHGGGGGGGGRH